MFVLVILLFRGLALAAVLACRLMVSMSRGIILLTGIGAALALALGASAALAGCGGGPSPVTIHGSVSPAEASSLTLPLSYSECSEESPSPGDQVTVTDPGGKVIGSATLGIWEHGSATADGITAYGCLEPFTMRDVPAEPRYGFSINTVPGVIWVTNVSHGVTLDVSSDGN